MGFLKVCVLSTLLLVQLAEAVALPTPPGDRPDSSTWSDNVAAQPTRVASIVSQDNDYVNLQSLLTKNIPGTSEEKNRMVDLLLQLLSEIDLPTLCEVIANDTSRKGKNYSRDVRTPESTTEAIEVILPTIETKPAIDEQKPFAIPYFNVLGQSNDKDLEQPSQSLKLSKGLSHESITNYHRNMVERVNRGMNAMRAYGHRRNAYINGMKRNRNVQLSQLEPTIASTLMPQVDEINELRNLHADESISDSLPTLWAVNPTVNVNVETNSSMKNEDSKLPSSSDDNLASKSILIHSMNVDRPSADLYARSLLNGEVNLIRTKRIDEGEEMYTKQEKFAPDSNNMVSPLSNKEEILQNDLNTAILDNINPEATSIILDAIQENVINDHKHNPNKYNGHSQGNNLPMQADKDASETELIENNNVHKGTTADYKEQTNVIFQPANPTNKISISNFFSNQSTKNFGETDPNFSKEKQNSTFESVNLSLESISSIDDYFGAIADSNNFVQSPESDSLHNSTNPTFPSVSNQVNLTADNVTFSERKYLTNVLFEFSSVNTTILEKSHFKTNSSNLDDDRTMVVQGTVNNGSEPLLNKTVRFVNGDETFPTNSDNSSHLNLTIEKRFENSGLEAASEENVFVAQSLNANTTNDLPRLSGFFNNLVNNTIYRLENESNVSTPEVVANNKNRSEFGMNQIKDLNESQNDQNNHLFNNSFSHEGRLNNNLDLSNNVTAMAATKMQDTKPTLANSFWSEALNNVSESVQIVNNENTDMHVAEKATKYNAHVKIDSAEPYIHYKPTEETAAVQPSLHIFGPYGEHDNKSEDKHDVIVADVKSTPEMSIESAKAELEMELKKLGGKDSGSNSDFISIIRGNQRGNQRGISSNTYNNILAQPVMKSLKRIHEQIKNQENAQIGTGFENIKIEDIGSLVSSQKNSRTDENSNGLSTLASPSYNIEHTSSDTAKQNVTINTDRNDETTTQNITNFTYVNGSFEYNLKTTEIEGKFNNTESNSNRVNTTNELIEVNHVITSKADNDSSRVNKTDTLETSEERQKLLNNFVTDEVNITTFSNDYEVLSNDSTSNQTSLVDSLEDVSENMTITNFTLTEDPTANNVSVNADEENTTLSESERNETQIKDNFLTYLTSKEDETSKQNSFVSLNPIFRKYNTLLAKYTNRKPKPKTPFSVEDYQNEILTRNRMQNSWNTHKPHILYHPDIKFAVRPEASPFLSEGSYTEEKRNSKFRPVARVNPWKAFNIELGKEKVRNQQEAKNNFRYPAFKIRLHDDVIVPSGKEYLWNARPWSAHDSSLEANLPSHNSKYSSGFSKVNDFLRQRQRDVNFLPLQAEHSKLWGDRFSQGFYGRVLDEQSFTPIMASYLNLPREQASYKSSNPEMRRLSDVILVDEKSPLDSTETNLQKDVPFRAQPTLSSSPRKDPITTKDTVKVESLVTNDPTSKDGNESSSLETNDNAVKMKQDPLPDYNIIPGPTGAPATDDFKCPGLFGYYTDPDDCSSFFMCSWAVSYRLKCSEGTLWNSVDSVCDWAANVRCGERKMS